MLDGGNRQTQTHKHNTNSTSPYPQKRTSHQIVLIPSFLMNLASNLLGLKRNRVATRTIRTIHVRQQENISEYQNTYKYLTIKLKNTELKIEYCNIEHKQNKNCIGLIIYILL
jgi:hypothetical protein